MLVYLIADIITLKFFKFDDINFLKKPPTPIGDCFLRFSRESKKQYKLSD